MPDYLNEKLKSGVLPLAIYADLMRVALLEHYGGTWMDATILLTDEIPQEILNSDFFVFHNSLGEIDNPVLYPVWFIHAKQHNRTIFEIRNVLFAYWKRKNHVPEYLFSNIVITQIMRSSPEVEKKMPYLNSDYSEYLVRVLGDKFTEEKFNWIKRLTGIHKLTYKLEPSIDKEEVFTISGACSNPVFQNNQIGSSTWVSGNVSFSGTVSLNFKYFLQTSVPPPRLPKQFSQLIILDNMKWVTKKFVPHSFLLDKFSSVLYSSSLSFHISPDYNSLYIFPIRLVFEELSLSPS